MLKAEFAKLMAGLSSTTHKKFAADEIEFWFGALADVDDDALKQAFYRFVATGDDWPSIAKIRALADEQRHGQHTTAGEAFENVTRAVRSYGHYSPEAGLASLDDVTTKALRASGGWRWICELSLENRSIFSAQFRKAYEAIIEREQQLRRTPEPLRPAITDGSLTETKRARLNGHAAKSVSSVTELAGRFRDPDF